MRRAVAIPTGGPHRLSHFLGGSSAPVRSWLSNWMSSSHHVPGLQPGQGIDRLTQEGLLVGTPLLHVRTRPDSTAAVMHLVHDSTTQKEGRERPLLTLSAPGEDPRIVS